MSAMPGGEAPKPMTPQQEVEGLKELLVANYEDRIAQLQATLMQVSQELETVSTELAALRTGQPVPAEAVEAVEADETEVNPVIREQRQPGRTGKSLIERLTPRRMRSAVALAGTLAVGFVFGLPAIKSSTEQAQADSKTKTTSTTSTTTSGKSKASKASSQTSHNAAVLAKAEGDDTVAEFLHDIQGDHQSTKSIIHAIFSESHTQRLDHDKGSMSSLRAEFQNRTLSARDYAIAVADSVKGSEGFAMKEYSVINGNSDGVSVEQARQAIENLMTAPGTTFSVEQPGGTYMNHGQRDENVFDAGIVSLTEGVQNVFVIHTESGKQLYFKVFNNNCVNILTPVTITVPVEQPTPAAPAPVEHPPVPGRPAPKRHHKHKRPHGGKPHHKHAKPGTPPPTQTPPPSTPPHNHHTAKHDDTPGRPAGNSENGGTGIQGPSTGPGQGPAGQPRDPEGHMPSEAPAPTQAPDPTPAPVETQPAPTPATPPETGQDNGPSQPPAPSTGTGTTVTGSTPPPSS